MRCWNSRNGTRLKASGMLPGRRTIGSRRASRHAFSRHVNAGRPRTTTPRRRRPIERRHVRRWRSDSAPSWTSRPRRRRQVGPMARLVGPRRRPGPAMAPRVRPRSRPRPGGVDRPSRSLRSRGRSRRTRRSRVSSAGRFVGRRRPWPWNRPTSWWTGCAGVHRSGIGSASTSRTSPRLSGRPRRLSTRTTTRGSSTSFRIARGNVSERQGSHDKHE